MPNPRYIPPSMRFRILHRDNFTCQYCGRSAPWVVLRIDHINPVAHGGGRQEENLITACHTCNAGKSDMTGVDAALVARTTEEGRSAGRMWLIHMLGTDGELNPPNQEIVDDSDDGNFPEKFRGPIKFNFDVYEAASALCPAKYQTLSPAEIAQMSEVF